MACEEIKKSAISESIQFHNRVIGNSAGSYDVFLRCITVMIQKAHKGTIKTIYFANSNIIT